MATHPDEKVRDGKKALEYAKKALELTDMKDGNSLSNVAAAYAECGDFEMAIKHQKMALENTDIFDSVRPKEEAIKEIQQNLKLYENRKPYRMKKPE